MTDQLIEVPGSRPYVVTVAAVLDSADVAGLEMTVAKLEAAGVPLAYFELVAQVGVIMTADDRQAAMSAGTAAVAAAAGGPMQIRGSEVRAMPASAVSLAAGHPA